MRMARTSVTPGAQLLTPAEVAHTLRRDLLNRATVQRVLRALAKAHASGDSLTFARRVQAVEHQLAGVFQAPEIEHFAQVIDERLRMRVWGGMIPVGRFGDLPAAPRVTRETVALAAVALEGRLLALRELSPGEPIPEAPDETLAEETHYSRSTVRQALRRTLAAIGLKAPGKARYPQRSAPAGATAVELAAQKKRNASAAKRRAARARAKSR
jgi:hypothetical protein